MGPQERAVPQHLRDARRGVRRRAGEPTRWFHHLPGDLTDHPAARPRAGRPTPRIEAPARPAPAGTSDAPVEGAAPSRPF